MGALFVCLLLPNLGLSIFAPHRFFLTAYGDTTQCLLLVVLLGAFLRNTKANEAGARLFWGLMSLSAGLWLCAQALWTYFEVVLRHSVANPFVGDILFFLQLVPIMGALAVRPDQEEQQVIHPGKLDFILLLVWWLYLYCFLVIPWQYVKFDPLTYGPSFDLAYSLEQLVVVVVAAKVWHQSKGAWRKIFGHILGASILYSFTSTAIGLAINNGEYFTGSLYDLPLLASIAWFAWSGILSHRLMPLSVPRKTAATRKSWISAAAMLTLPSLPAMAAWSVLWSSAPVVVKNFRLLLTLSAMVVMGLLVWIKQFMLDRELARVNQDLREDSLTDLLTGARNRRFLASTIETDVRHAIRSYFPAAGVRRNRDLIFYVVDADTFKDVNDRYGHDVGDKLLVEMAGRISSAIRHSDALIRWGGDEFLVVSRNSNRHDAATLASRILLNVAGEPFDLVPGLPIFQSCSIGWAVFPWFVNDPGAVGYPDVLRVADCALYQAKHAGKNQAVGMLPAFEEPQASSSPVIGSEGQLTDELGVKSLVCTGPQIPVFSPASSDNATRTRYFGA
jgi:diguanylate cyclase (GGDEF)-like protein